MTRAGYRGLFISFGGFTEEGIHAFGRGRRIIGMDGRDLYHSLERGIPVDRLAAPRIRIAPRALSWRSFR